MNAGLKLIYGKDLHDLKTMKRRRSGSGILGKIVFLLFVACILAYGGAYLYARFAFQPESGDFSIDLVPPEKIISGELFTLIINYNNDSRLPLGNLHLSLQTPADFNAESVLPNHLSLEELDWDLGTMSANQSGTITITGRWLTTVPREASFQALARYKPSNFNSEFTKLASERLKVDQTPLTLSWTGPNTLQAGEEGTYQLTLQNLGAEPVPLTTLLLELPPNFNLKSAKPPFIAGEPTFWEIPTLAPGENYLGTITGTFGSVVGSEEFNLVAISQLTTAGEKLEWQKISFPVMVENPPLTFSLFANGATALLDLALGEKIRLTVRLDNQSSEPITPKNIVIDFEPDGSFPILWKEANLDGGKLTAQGIVFDASTLGVIPPGGKFMASLILPTKTTLSETDLILWTATAHLSWSEGILDTAPVGLGVVR